MDSGCGSAMKDFFNTINSYIQDEEGSSSPPAREPPQSTINERGQLQIGQLKFLKLAIDHEPNGYGAKLIEIMTNGLRETLGPLYEVTIRSGLPKSFLPVIGINNDNTPFVEFIVKSDKADDAPFSAEYTPEHLELAQFITDHLIKNARNKRLKTSTPYKDRGIKATPGHQLTSYEPSPKETNNIEALFRTVKQNQDKQFSQILRARQQQSSFVTASNRTSSAKVAKSTESEPDPILEVSHNQIMTVGRSSSRRINPNRSCKSLNVSYT